MDVETLLVVGQAFRHLLRGRRVLRMQQVAQRWHAEEYRDDFKVRRQGTHFIKLRFGLNIRAHSSFIGRSRRRSSRIKIEGGGRSMHHRLSYGTGVRQLNARTSVSVGFTLSNGKLADRALRQRHIVVQTLQRECSRNNRTAPGRIGRKRMTY